MQDNHVSVLNDLSCCKNEAMPDFIQEFLKQLKTLKQGDPFDKNSTTGPMARPDLVASLEKQMHHSHYDGSET